MSLFLTPYQFRFCPARYIHPDNLIYPWADVMTLMPDWRQQPGNNGLLLKVLALNTDYVHPGEHDAIALSSPEYFRQLTVLLGAVLHARSLRTSLSAATLRHVHHAIGIEGHRFCLSQLDLLIGKWPDEWQHPLPEGALTDYFSHWGLSFWCGALHDTSPGFIRRLWLRLPKGSGGIDKGVVQHHPALAQVLCQKIIKKVSQECGHLLK